jgi:hypothetical protein
MQEVCADPGTDLAESTARRPCPPAGKLPARRRPVQAGQRPQWGVIPPAAAGVPRLRRHYWRADRLWSGSYSAGSAGGPPSASCASTSSSRTAPPLTTGSRPSAFTTRPEDRHTGGQIGSREAAVPARPGHRACPPPPRRERPAAGGGWLIKSAAAVYQLACRGSLSYKRVYCHLPKALIIVESEKAGTDHAR